MRLSSPNDYYPKTLSELLERSYGESSAKQGEHLKAIQHNLLDNLPFLAWMKSREGRYVAVNKFFLELFNVEEEDIIGKTTHDIWPKELSDKLVISDERMMETGKAFEEQFELVGKDGKKSWFVFFKQPIISADGEIIGSTGFRWDVTDRVLIEQALSDRIEFQKIVMELAVAFVNTPLYELDQGINNALAMVGNFSKVDRVYQFRYNFEAGIMINTHEWCAPDITPEIDNLQELPTVMFPDWVNAHLKGDMTYYPVVADLPPEHSVRQILEPQGVQSIVTLPLYHDGHCFGFVGFDSVRKPKEWNEYEIMLLRVMSTILTNAEIRRAYEQSLLNAKAESEAASLAKSEFLANMSHEIRTPLHGVISMINLLKGTVLTEEQQEFLQMADSSAESLLNVINDILDFSKIEAGKLELIPRIFDLEDEITRLLNIFSARAKEKEVELLVRYELSAPRVIEADNFRLRQVLNNLLSNAIKFTDTGYVLLNVRCLSADNDRAELEFSVEDTGIGIPQEKIAVIFEQFAQVDGSSSRKFEGTGLGLAICRRLVSLMKGSLSVESVLGQGSKFMFNITVPFRNSKSSLLEEQFPLKGRKALIVDDISINRRILSEYLTSWGVEHDMASNSLSALRLINSPAEDVRPYDFMILDQAMPGMDGVELAKLLSSNKQAATPKIILMTSMWGLLSQAQAAEVGISSLIPKPTAPSDLLNAIRDCIYGHRFSDKPEQAKEESSPGAEARDNQPEPVKRNVLVVDDRVINRKAASFMIEKLGFKVYAAENGLEALSIVQEVNFHMVFLDVQMPVMDGYETCKAIRSLGGRYAALPIIALTANATESSREACLAAGMNDYLSKPMEKDKLIAIINTYDSHASEIDDTEEEQNDLGGFMDFNHSDLLSRYGDELEFIKELLSDFISEGTANLKEMTEAVAKHDNETEAIAHRLKGSCSYAGADKMKELCALIMGASSKGNWKSAENYARQTPAAWDAFAAAAGLWMDSADKDAK